MTLFAGVEAGGTKIRCAIGDEHGAIIDEMRIPTQTPEETIPKLIEYFQQKHVNYPFQAMGLGCFGPLCLDERAANYGYITKTPKLEWVDCDFLGAFKSTFDLPIGFDTDVNGAVLAESMWGRGKGLDNIVYLTIGTGIGGGVLMNGKLCHGAMHPEMGHIFIPHDKQEDPFLGVCAYHQDCLEGLASGPAMKERWGVSSALDLPLEHKAWDLEASYLAYALAKYILTLSPQRIILGGGVMKQEHLFAKIRERVKTLLHGYVQHDTVIKNIDSTIVPPALGQEAGLCGAIALASNKHAQCGLPIA